MDIRSPARRTLDSDRSIVQGDYLAANSQSETGSFGLSGEERLEYAVQVFFRYAGTVVPDVDFNQRFTANRVDLYYAAGFPGGVGRVIQQVADDLFQLGGIGLNGNTLYRIKLGPDRDPPSGPGLPFLQLDALPDKIMNVHQLIAGRLIRE